MMFLSSQGQDPHYSQFYAASTYLNPAFAGTSIQHRLSANYRNQWPSIPGGFSNYSFAYDRYAPMINSGFGFLATQDKAGSGSLSNTSLSFQYAYEARIKSNVFIRPALQMTFNNKSISFGDLTFGDQLIRDEAVSLEEAIGQPINYFDFSSGILLTTHKLWLGFSAHHINQPNEALYGDVFSFLPVKYSLHGGYRVKVKSRFSRHKPSALVAFNYKQQGEFSQLDAGLYYELDPFILGIWYRNLPTKSNGYSHPNHDAVAVIFGWQDGPYKIGYSYDLTVSQLGVSSSGGAHELSVAYEWANKRNKRLAKRRIIPCAKF